MKFDIIKVNKTLNIVLYILLISITYLYYKQSNAAWIIILFSMIFCILIVLAFSYRSMYKKHFKELQNDGLMKLSLLCMVCILLPYTNDWSILYISILIGMILMDYIQRARIYKCILSNTASSSYYLTGHEDTDIQIRLLFSHSISLFFFDSAVIWKGIICIGVLVYTMFEFRSFYKKYHTTYDKAYFIRIFGFYYTCYFITSLMNLYQFMNFSYYLICSLSICGFWKKVYNEE